MILHRRHFHDAQGRFCAKGLRAWMRERGVAWQDFIDNGIAPERLREIGGGDYRVQIVIDNAERENG